MARVRLENVSKAFGRTEVIRGVDLDVADGEFVVFVGPSGCGKSTLLRLIAGLEEPTGGEIFIGEDRVTDVAPARRGVSMVFQSYALYPHMTVYGNIAFGLKLAKASAGTVEERVRKAARMLQIEALLDRRPRELSGGQRQRVAIARAIVREPRAFLFDEPLSNLDAALRAQTRLEIAAMHRDLGATMIYVTHDQLEAMTLADRMVVLNRGRVEQAGPPAELYHRPRTRFVAAFLGAPQMNLLPATVEGGRARFASTEAVAVESGCYAGPATLGVRPESIAIVEDGPFAARVQLVEELGEARIVHAALGDGARLSVRHAGQGVRRGDAVRLAFDPVGLHLFGEDGLRIEASPPG